MAQQRIKVLLPALTAGVLFFSSCSGGASKESESAGTGGKALAADEYTGGPVELLVQDRNTGMTPEEFENFFAKPVKTKYPDITLKLTQEKDYQKLVAGGTPPDLVAVSNTLLTDFFDLDYPQDLTEMIKRFNINLDLLEPSIVDALKGLGRGTIYGLPFGMNYGAMIYNKDLFDKFGVSYPKDIITWDEYLDLSSKLTRMEDGVQYIGGSPSSVPNLLKQYGASSVDAADGKMILTSDKHRAIYSLEKSFFEIPGLIQGKTYQQTNINNGKIAMLPNWIASWTGTVLKSKPAYNWDVIAHPVFKERPNIGNPIDFHMLTVGKASKNKEAAYRVILTMLSPAAQEELTKNSRITPLKDPKLKAMFAQDSNVYEGKNLLSIFKVAPAPLPDYSKWSTLITTYSNAVAEDMALNKKDMNTAMREQEEKANKALDEAKAAKK
ncbi:MAG: family 1 extracellular solute-binding protein [Paenibacillus sp.]|jgi:multiple sugar transport system substrate-binding protein|nr:family 1 extracellular solute-binding protein [Paenibacillus sp.]